MLYAVTCSGRLLKVVDSPTDLDRMPPDLVKRMCRDLKLPWRDVSGQTVKVGGDELLVMKEDDLFAVVEK